VTEQVHIDPEKDLIWTTVAEYEFFMAHGRLGMDGLSVRQHLIYTARRQNNNRVRATTTYIVNGTRVSEKRVKAAKAFLLEHGFIKYHQAEPAKGAPYMGKMYIEVRFPPLTGGPYETQQTGSPHRTQQTGGPYETQQTGGVESTPAESTPAESTPAESTPAESTPAQKGSRNSLGEKKEEKSTAPLFPYKKALEECRKLFHQKYEVGLRIPHDVTVKAFREVRLSNNEIIAAYHLYLADKADFLTKEKHPWRTFLSQLSTYAAKVKGAVKAPARYCPKCGEVETSNSRTCLKCNVELEVRNAD
jgi:hypothetical protein